MDKKDNSSPFGLIVIIGLLIIIGLLRDLEKKASSKKVVSKNKYIKTVSKNLFKYFLAPTKIIRDYIGVNATILSLILATLSAYVIYSVGKTDEMKARIFQEAEKINTLEFITDFDVLYDKTLYDTSDPKNRTYLLVRLDSIVKGSFTFDELWMTPIGFSNDPALRGEEIIRTMRSVSQHYPFRKPFKETRITPVGTQEIVYEHLRFEDIDKTGKWADDLTEVVSRFNQAIYGSTNMFSEKIKAYNDKLRDQYISQNGAETGLPPENENMKARLHNFDQTSPASELKLFLNNINRAGEIATATHLQYEQLKAHQARSLRTNMFISRGYIFAWIAFVCGVVIPMVCARLPRLLVLYVPIIFYLSIFVAVGYLIFQL